MPGAIKDQEGRNLQNSLYIYKQQQMSLSPKTSSAVDNIPKLLISMSDLAVICCADVRSIYLAVQQMSEYHVWSKSKIGKALPTAC